MYNGIGLQTTRGMYFVLSVLVLLFVCVCVCVCMCMFVFACVCVCVCTVVFLLVWMRVRLAHGAFTEKNGACVCHDHLRS